MEYDSHIQRGKYQSRRGVLLDLLCNTEYYTTPSKGEGWFDNYIHRFYFHSKILLGLGKIIYNTAVPATSCYSTECHDRRN